MTIWIILFWVVGVGLIVGVAVYRGIKKGPTRFDDSPLEELHRSYAQAREESASSSQQLQQHVDEIRAEVARLNGKIDSLLSEQADTTSKKTTVSDEAIKELQDRLRQLAAESGHGISKPRDHLSMRIAREMVVAAKGDFPYEFPSLSHATTYKYAGSGVFERKGGDKSILRLGLD